MTTILVTDTEIAWDSRLMMGETRILDTAEPKVVVRNGIIIGNSGDSVPYDQFATWFKRKFNPRWKPTGEWTVVYITPNGILLCDDTDAGPTQVHAPFAIGSGSGLALGAYLAGKGVIECIQIAAERDSGTGLPAHALRYADVFAKKPNKKRTRRRR